MVDAVKEIEARLLKFKICKVPGPNRDCSLHVRYYEKVVSVSNRRNKNKMRKRNEQ